MYGKMEMGYDPYSNQLAKDGIIQLCDDRAISLW